MVANWMDATNLLFVKYFLHSYIPVYLQHFVVQPVYSDQTCFINYNITAPLARIDTGSTQLYKQSSGTTLV